MPEIGTSGLTSGDGKRGGARRRSRAHPRLYRRVCFLRIHEDGCTTPYARLPASSPHQHPDGKWLFLTWHLHGSLPHARYPPRDKLSSGAAFVWMDRYLDTTLLGPKYLAQESIAGIVVAALRRGEQLNQYDLGAYVIMSNHVHVLLLPKSRHPD